MPLFSNYTFIIFVFSILHLSYTHYLPSFPNLSLNGIESAMGNRELEASGGFEAVLY